MPLFGRRNTLRDKVVLLTGASDGVGAACVRVFRGRGARLSITGRSAEKLSRFAAHGDLAIPADLTQPGTPEMLVAETIREFGRIDVLINNAGSGMYGPSWASPEAETRALFDLNLFVPLALIRSAVPGMRERACGSIVNVSSVAGRVVLPWMPLYSVSKFALSALTDSLRMELNRDGIHVMEVCPGYVGTDFQTHAVGAPPSAVEEGKRFAISAETCAEAIARGIERRAKTVVTPPWARLLLEANRILPRVVESQLTRLNQPVERA